MEIKMNALKGLEIARKKYYFVQTSILRLTQ